MAKTKVRKAKAISFSPVMSQSIRKGLKTHTRRILRTQPYLKEEAWYWEHSRYDNGAGVKYFWSKEITPSLRRGMALCNPYGQPGDLLYVKEEYWRYGAWIKTGDKTPTGADKLLFKPVGDQVLFDLRPQRHLMANRNDQKPGWVYRHARFMPREDSRTLLRIKSVDVSRLLYMSRYDFSAEGCQFVDQIVDGTIIASGWAMGGYDHGMLWDTPIRAFSSYWDSLNATRSQCASCQGKGKVVKFKKGNPYSVICGECVAKGLPSRPFSWAGNPFVDVIEFEVLEAK